MQYLLFLSIYLSIYLSISLSLHLSNLFILTDTKLEPFLEKKQDLYIWPGSYSYELEALKITTVRTQHFIYRICSCPCTQSHLEPLVCIHIFRSIHVSYYRYSCIHIYTYMNRCCANSHMSLLVGTLTLRTSLYTIHISTSIHISYDRYFCI